MEDVVEEDKGKGKEEVKKESVSKEEEKKEDDYDFF
jgi:hypothetical protein